MIIAMYRSKGILPALIRFFSRGRYNHCAIVHDGMCYESRQGCGVRVVKFVDSIDMGDKIDFYTVMTTPEQDGRILNYFEMNIGRPYDYKGVWRFIDRQSDEADERDHTWFCSEIVAWAFRMAGVALFNCHDDWKFSPTDLTYSLRVTKR